MRLRRDEYIIFRRGPNVRLWVSAGVGILGFISGLALSWGFILSLVIGVFLGIVVYARR